MSKTRAAVPAPPKKGGFLPDVPKAGAADNMKGESLVGMTFNMPTEWHREFKATAAMNGMDMKKLLTECFAAWKRENNG